MSSPSYPGRWKESAEQHPEHGVVAYSESRFKHTAGFEITVWSGVEENATDYTVGENDEFAVEVSKESGEYIEGESFETKEAALQAARDMMMKYPREAQ